MIDHLGIQAADVDAAVAFYLRVFAPLGFQEVLRYPVGESAAEAGAEVLHAPREWPHER